MLASTSCGVPTGSRLSTSKLRLGPDNFIESFDQGEFSVRVGTDAPVPVNVTGVRSDIAKNIICDRQRSHEAV